MSGLRADALDGRLRHAHHVAAEDLANVVVAVAALHHAHGHQRPVGPGQAAGGCFVRRGQGMVVRLPVAPPLRGKTRIL